MPGIRLSAQLQLRLQTCLPLHLHMEDKLGIRPAEETCFEVVLYNSWSEGMVSDAMEWEEWSLRGG